MPLSPDSLRTFLPRPEGDVPTTSVPDPSTASTDLPSNLPLAFPTPLHRSNTLASLHLVHAWLAQPRWTSYWAATSPSTPADTALAGVMGLYLSSGEGWGPDNLLSAEAWRSDRLSTELLAEYFRIETTREEEHPTIKAIRVGGRYEPGAELVEELRRWIASVAEKLGDRKCLGEWPGIWVD
mgnify:CR=1 FL=1